jgi:hypothetical protein
LLLTTAANAAGALQHSWRVAAAEQQSVSGVHGCGQWMWLCNGNSLSRFIDIEDEFK